MRWNPNDTDSCAVGLEWAPLRQADRPVTGVGSSSYSWLMESTVTEDIDRMYTYSSVAVPSAYDVVDIYDVTDLAPVRPVTDRLPYTSDAIAARFVRPTGGRYYSGDARTESVDQARMTAVSEGWFSLIDDTPLVAGTYRGRIGSTITSTFDDPVPIINRQFIGLTAFPSLLDPIGGDYASSFSQWAFHVNGLATNVTGKRILGLTVKCLCQRLVDPRARSSEFDQPYRIRPAVIVGGVNTFGQAQLMPSTPQEVSYTWFQNPQTGKAWTASELTAFQSSTATNAVAWLMSRPDDPAVRQATAGAIFRAWAEVTYADETRVAEAVRTEARQNVGWNEWKVTAIGGGDWAKTDTDTYLMNARLNAQQAVDWRPTLSTTGLSVKALGDATGVSNGVSEVVPSFVGQIPRAVGEETGFTPAVLLREPVSGGSDLSVDGNPYAVIYDANEVQVLRPTGQPVLEQLVMFDAADEPDVVRLWVRSETGDRPTGTLTVEVFDDTATLEATSDPFDGADLLFPARWQKVELPLTAATWTTGVEVHTVRVTAAGGDVGWQVLTLTDGTQEPDATSLDIDPYDVGYGNGTLYASGGDPFAARLDADCAVVLGRKPQTPTGLTVTADPNNADGPAMSVSWVSNPTDDCSGFGRYEIQRASLSDGGSLYDVRTVFVADVDGSSTSLAFFDYEAPRNATNGYRVRMVSDVGFAGDWTDLETDELQDDRCGYWFRSNFAPHLNVWFDDIGDRSFTFPEQTTYFEFEGRDGTEQVRGTTDQLDRFTLSVLIAGRGATAPTPQPDDLTVTGRRVFDRVLIMAGNKRDDDGTLYRLPWVMVSDQDGVNWFAGLITPTGTQAAPAAQYLATVEVTELTRNPDPVVLIDSGAGTLVPRDAYPDGVGS